MNSAIEIFSTLAVASYIAMAILVVNFCFSIYMILFNKYGR
jgi:hypothetical protein